MYNHLLAEDLGGFLQYRFHLLQEHEQRHLLPPGQHPRGGNLRPGSQLCGAMLGTWGRALSFGTPYYWYVILGYSQSSWVIMSHI